MPELLAFRGAFRASTDDGTVYLLDVFEIIQDHQIGGMRGPLVYRTADGGAVKRLGRGIYEIEESGLIVRSVTEGSSSSNPQLDA
jgi:hypothetical protein